MMKRLMKKQAGLAAVEFIITVPLLLVLLGGIVEFGNAFVRYNTLSKTVQNGCRYAVTDIYGTSNSDSIAQVADIKNMVVYGNKAGTGTPLLTTLTVDDVTVIHADKFVVVSASYDYVPLLNILPDALLANIVLSSSAVMRTTL
ncbi:TadE/TadG family type IV pilus assembly protein [Vibrio sp. CJQ_6]|uniref:TadE/TadG family type IV pilus assembly protein n=1 Tax=Vibrio sp. CJQ_6 TaxID=3367165 RepID=UPI00370A129E